MKSRQNSLFRFLKPVLGILATVTIVVMTLFTFSIISKSTVQSSNSEAKLSAEKEEQRLQPDDTPLKSGEPDKVAVSKTHDESVIAKKTVNSIDEITLDWSKTQPLALHKCAANDWDEAVKIWEQQLKSRPAKTYTVLLVSVNKGIYLESIFEQFANSAKLRQDFFILSRQKGSEQLFSACWGIFPDLASAQRAGDTLPERIRQLYNPSAQSVAELHGN